ncbi:MAG TPA: PIN domain-containing protein [Vicinamibacterales bacterium]|nr:PIN domain-containing protein [Vicinamibacterales bacterium]
MGPLVDTSVLIDFFGGRSTAGARAFDRLLEAGTVPATAPVIVQEFLQGFTTAGDLAKARDYLGRLEPLPPADYEVHEAGAGLHRLLRRSGFTMSTIDCLIVATARHFRRDLLTADDGQRRLARAAAVTLV